MLNHQFLKPPQLLGREAEVSGEANRLQPELGRQIVPVNMDMRWLIGFMAVEVEAVRAAPNTVGISYPFSRVTGQ